MSVHARHSRAGATPTAGWRLSRAERESAPQRPIRHRARRPRSRFVAPALVAVLAIAGAGTAVAAGGSAAWAAYLAYAQLNADFSSQFGMGLLNTEDGVFAVSDGELGEFAAGDTTQFVPGTPLHLSLTAFNNSASMTAIPELRLSELVVSPANAADLIWVEATQTDADGTPVPIDLDPASDETGAALGALEGSVLSGHPLAERGEAPLTVGDAWSGDAASRTTITITFTLLANEATQALQYAGFDTTVTLAGRTHA